MACGAPAPSRMPSLVNVQFETRIRAELPEAAISRLSRSKRQKRHLGLRANTNIEPEAIITHCAFAPIVYESEQAAYDAGYKYLYKYMRGFVAMLNPRPSLRTSDHRGVYCNHAGKGGKPANARINVSYSQGHRYSCWSAHWLRSHLACQDKSHSAPGVRARGLWSGLRC